MYDIVYVLGAWLSPTAVCAVWIIGAERMYRRSLAKAQAAQTAAHVKSRVYFDAAKRQAALRIKAEDRYAFLIKHAYLRDDRGRIRKASEII